MRKVPPRFGVWATAGPGAPVAAAAPPSFRRSRRLTVERGSLAMEFSFGQGILRRKAVPVENSRRRHSRGVLVAIEGPEPGASLPLRRQASEVGATLRGNGRGVKHAQ